MQPIAPPTDAVGNVPDVPDAVATPAPDERRVSRLLLFLGVVALAFVAVQFSPVGAVVRDVARVRGWVDGLGALAFPAVILASAVLVACGFPRLVLCGVGAAVLGFWWGLILTQVGGLLGHYAFFCFVRWGGGDWVVRRHPRLCAVADGIGRQGVAGVVLARQLPIHGTLINFCLGLSRAVSHRRFLIGTAIGMAPEGVPAALVGAGLVEASATRAAGTMALAALAAAVVWIGSAYLLRKRGKSAALRARR